MSERLTDAEIDPPLELREGDRMQFEYVNHRGERALRTARVIGWRWGATEWHPVPQWLMAALDDARGEIRHFACRDMTEVRKL
jgi:hypothetical protein